MSSPDVRRFSLVYPYDIRADGERVIRWHSSMIQWDCHVGKNLQHRDRFILAPELPYAVIPCRVRRRWNLQYSPLPAAEWVNGQVPAWEGIPCDGGYITIWVDSFRRIPGLADSRYWQKIKILAIFPEYDPTPAPLEAMLGCEFFHSYRLLLSIRYNLIIPRDRTDLTLQDRTLDIKNVRDINPNLRCGRLIYSPSLSEE
jgi:hypothetical protein